MTKVGPVNVPTTWCSNSSSTSLPGTAVGWNSMPSRSHRVTRCSREVLGVISAPNLILNAAAPLLFALLLGVVSAQASLLIAGAAALASTLFMVWLARLHPQKA